MSLAAGGVLRVLRRFHLGGWTATRILIIDLYDLLARRLVTGRRLRTRLWVADFPLALAHHPNRTPAAKLRV